jgi:hypothetical protein
VRAEARGLCGLRGRLRGAGMVADCGMWIAGGRFTGAWSSALPAVDPGRTWRAPESHRDLRAAPRAEKTRTKKSRPNISGSTGDHEFPSWQPKIKRGLKAGKRSSCPRSTTSGTHGARVANALIPCHFICTIHTKQPTDVPAPAGTDPDQCAGSGSSFSVFTNAMMSFISSSVIAGWSPNLRSNGASVMSMFFRYCGGISSYAWTLPSGPFG